MKFFEKRIFKEKSFGEFDGFLDIRQSLKIILGITIQYFFIPTIQINLFLIKFTTLLKIMQIDLIMNKRKK